MIKLFAWESHLLKELGEKRRDELKQIKKGRLLNIAMFAVNMTLPLVAKLATFATYVRDSTLVNDAPTLTLCRRW